MAWHSETGGPAWRMVHESLAGRLERLFLGRTSVAQLLLITVVPVLVGAWLLVSPDNMLSREMTADLLFNISAGWRIQSGQVPHVDFHDPLGSLGFALTYVGFHIVGLEPRAFLAGEMIFLAFAFASAIVAAASRLPLIPAIIFVLYAALLVLMPLNIGDQPNAYSFAMPYNRWGWSMLATLCLILFLPPRAAQPGPWVDAVNAALLLVAMFYLKITFAAAGLAALVVALVISDHVRGRWVLWGAVLVLILASFAAPYNDAYLTDIWEAANGGYARTSWPDEFRKFFANKEEHALYGSGVLLLLWLWLRGQASFSYVVAAGFVICLGLFVLSQNAQVAGVPLGLIVAFLIYDTVRVQHGDAQSVPVLLAVLTLPLLSAASAATTLIGYHMVARQSAFLMTVGTTNLRGLAVPAGQVDTPGVMTAQGNPYHLRGRTGDASRNSISESTYVEAFLEAATLFANDRRGRPRILVLDAVNPMPFMLGYPPSHGGNLWLWGGGPQRNVEEVFGDVDYVLIPKYSSYASTSALAEFKRYLFENFKTEEQTAHWTLLGRSEAIAASSPEIPPP